MSAKTKSDTSAQKKSDRLHALVKENYIPKAAMDFLIETKTPLATAEGLIKAAAPGCTWRKAFNLAKIH